MTTQIQKQARKSNRPNGGNNIAPNAVKEGDSEGLMLLWDSKPLSNNDAITEATILEAERLRQKLIGEASKLDTYTPNSLGDRMICQSIKLFWGCGKFSGKQVSNEHAKHLIKEGGNLLAFLPKLTS